MTDLLGALMALQAAVLAGDVVRIARTALDGMAGAVDHDTRTIHVSPDLSPDEWLATFAAGLHTLNAGRGDPTRALDKVTATGDCSSSGSIPRPRLRLISDS